MSDPIRIKILVSNRGDRTPFHDSLGHYRNALPDDVSGPAYDVVEMVEVTPPKTCATCKRRRYESDYNEMRDEHMSWYECPLLTDEAFDERVNDGTGFCHRYEEKQDG